MESRFVNQFLVLFVIRCVRYSESINEPCKQQTFVKVSQDGLAPVNALKATTVTSSAFCSFDCAEHSSCSSFVLLKQKTSENCLLSSDPDGGRSQEESETFKSILKLPGTYDQVCKINSCQRRATCVPSCTYPHYTCKCPEWASGFYCENLNPGYSPNLISWTARSGYGVKTVGSAHVTWCTTTRENIFFYRLDSNAWVPVDGKLAQISVGKNGILGVASSLQIFQRVGVTAANPGGSAWEVFANGLLTQITSGETGIIWGINHSSKLFYFYSGVWKIFSGGFKWVSCGKFGCWVILSDGSASFRTGVTSSNPGGVSWVDTGGSLKQLDCSLYTGEVYAVDDAGQVYTREGITENLPEGTKWSQFGNTLFAHVSVGDEFISGATAGDGRFYTVP